ncbi:hypothetical protein RTG_02374 [Rhodotorula toruloides ATCC 204091]|uniref:Uncharacterized protein n=2 Tax=Rhodotorula toruloides TaxID=5286 RepID=A0A2T0A8P0_RHOTO|nr:hypothetical protein RTG_02374 [Rhodotorula toruloides ATCC 204091]KAK4336297.1 hypothetical protein RTBOTA2_005081 [Rhodotorula toruloides]PRQ74387.1 hypothetical protein AAT19DRAFT_14740 [Rhodotorula toruloides]
MAYPPVPYPPLQVIQESETGRPASNAAADEGNKRANESSENASQAKRRPLFSSPFKTPSTVSTSQVPATPRRTKVQDLASGSQTSPESTETSPTTPSAVPARRFARTTVPFKTPTKSTPAASERSTAAEIAQLERRIAHLRQARRYQLATERGDRDGDGELERLCDKWKDAGKLAAEMLFEQLPSPDSASSTTNDPFASWGFADASATSKRTSSDAWGSSWGFSSSPPSSDPLGPGSSSFFTKRGPTSEEVVSDFMHKVDEEAQRLGVSRLKVLEEFEDREHDDGGLDLEHPDVQFAKLAQISKKRVGVKRKGGTGASSSAASKRVKLETLDKESMSAKPADDDDSEDELLEALDELIATSSQAKEVDGEEIDEEEREEEQDDQREPVEREEPIFEDEAEEDMEGEVEQPQEKEWNVGRMMQRVGIDPTLFGWDETFEAFA